MNTRTFDPSIIDPANESLIHYHFGRLATELGMSRRAAEVLFRNSWDKLSRNISTDRNHTYLVLTTVILEATK